MQRLSIQKPKPLIPFSEANKLVQDNQKPMHRDSMLSPNDVDSEYSDTDNKPIVSKSALHSQNANNRLSKPVEILTDTGRKSTAPPSLSPSPPTPINKPLASPASNPIATTTAANIIPRNLMDRMKERHRLESRRSLQTSPFLDNTQASSGNLSSPSMPIIFSAATADQQPPHYNNNGSGGSSRPQRPLVQSHSFTTYVKPMNPSLTGPKRQSGHLVRSTSVVNDMYRNASINPTASTSNIIAGFQPIQVYLLNYPTYFMNTDELT
jgi:hypothetical protein